MMNMRKDREFIVSEEEVTTVLKVIANLTGITNYDVGECTFEGEPKWFIAFFVNDKHYGQIVKALSEIGKLTVKCGSEDKIATIHFERV